MLTRHARAQRSDEIDAKFGFERYLATTDRMGWLINMHPVCGNLILITVHVTFYPPQADILDENKRLVSAVDFYFIEEDGQRFKATMPFQPYFYIATKRVSTVMAAGMHTHTHTHTHTNILGHRARGELVPKSKALWSSSWHRHG